MPWHAQRNLLCMGVLLASKCWPALGSCIWPGTNYKHLPRLHAHAAPAGETLSAEALLSSINRCYRKVLPNRPSMVLLGVPPGQASSSSTSSKAHAGADSKAGVAEPQEGASVAATAAAAGSEAGAAVTAESSRLAEAGAGAGAGKQAVPAVGAPAAAEWQPQRSQYWTTEKVLFWGAVFVLRCVRTGLFGRGSTLHGAVGSKDGGLLLPLWAKHLVQTPRYAISLALANIHA